MFQLAAWRSLCVIVSFPLSTASTAKLISVESFKTVSFACFSARSIVNFYSEESKPLKWVKSINVMFSIRVQVVIRSDAGLIGSQDAYTKVNARKAKIISQSACSKILRETEMAIRARIPCIRTFSCCAARLLSSLVWRQNSFSLERNCESAFSWRSWTSLKGLQMSVAQLALIHPLFFSCF